MKTTAEYIAETKQILGLKTDYALAKWLGVTKQAASNWSRGKNGLDDYAAAKIAEALGLNPIEVIAVANMEREKMSERQEFWRRIARGGIAASVLFVLIFQQVSQLDAESANFTIYTLCEVATAWLIEAVILISTLCFYRTYLRCTFAESPAIL